MIKVIDQRGEQHEITEKMWESLKTMPKCRFRLAEVPVPKEVIEFRPTPTKAQQPNDIEKFIEHKECCKQECEKKMYEINPEVLQNSDETVAGYEQKQDRPKAKRTTKRKEKK